MIRFALILIGVLTEPVYAWNALGHKTIADIAWQNIDPIVRQRVVDDLRRHPRFSEDFVKEAPADVAGDKAIEDRWIFQQAATWPDIARGGEYDRPTWHYVNFPLFVDDRREVAANRSNKFPTRIGPDAYNVSQATKYAIATLKNRSSPADARAVAYCWLFHLVGDMHQPMHSTALFSDYFSDGDRGGNSIPLARGRNLHSLWDNLLGRQSRMRDVEREIAELRADRELWNVDAKGDVDDWIAESHELAKSVAYDPLILKAVRDVKPGTRLLPIVLPESYAKEAGRIARQRIVAAGLRLAGLLNDMHEHERVEGQ